MNISGAAAPKAIDLGWKRGRTCDGGKSVLPENHLIGRACVEPKLGRAAHLFAFWDTIRRRIILAERVILLSDFDGTLVPLQRRPSDVRMPSSLRRLFRRLVPGGIKLGIISGRAIQDVRKRVGVDGIWYSGSHGYFLRDPRDRTICLLPATIESKMKGLTQLLRSRFGFTSGIEVEPKDGTIAVHYRRATNTERTCAYQVLCKVLAVQKHLRLMPGKHVWEVLPEGTVNKWKAVKVILEREHFAPAEDCSCTWETT